jgi:hypothetical protein
MKQTGYDYYPMRQGVTHEYGINEITGAVYSLPNNQLMSSIPSDAYAYYLNILTRTPHANSPQYISFHHDASNKAFGELPFFSSYYSYTYTKDLVDSEAMLASFGTAWDGLQNMPYIGEIRNQYGNFSIPPNPLLPLIPRAGQVLDVHISLYDADANLLNPDWRTTLYVLDHPATWNGFHDCWRVVLTERANSYVYEFVFAKRIGVVNLWYGQLINGVVNGYEYYLTKVIKGSR